MNIDKFSEALQKRNPDNYLIGFFNDMYEEHQQRESYISELEYNQLGHETRQRKVLETLADCKRLRNGVTRNIKQMRAHKNWKPVLVKGGKNA